MKTSLAACTFGVFLAASTIATAAASVDQQVVGPVGEKDKYIVSRRGGHLATVSPKGSRVTVVVDGVVGPRFDEIVETTWGAIDPRPWEGVDANLQPKGAQVTFSRSGNRYAYMARLGPEWVVMVDNKESFRIPAAGAVGAVSGIAGMAGNTDVRMEFTGLGGKHLLVAKSGLGGYELWVDGQKWPGTYASGGGGSEGTVDPIISPDGEHVAYVAQMSREKRSLVIDGKEAAYFGTRLQYTPDSKHLLCISESPKGHAVLLDGKPLFAARQILNVFVPPAGNRLIFALVHFNAEGTANEGSFLLVDGKPAEATLTKSGIGRVIFSPDGKHYAAICGELARRFVVIDGKKGQEYFNIVEKDVADLATGIRFSPDSSKVVYTAYSNGGRDQFVVMNEDESDAMTSPWFRFSPDGKRLAYGGGVGNQGQKGVLIVDGKPVPLPPEWFVESKTFTFSPDGSRYAFTAAGRGGKGVFVDGKNTEIVGDFTFSPDSKHLAILGGGGPGPEKKQGLFVDGQIVFEPASSYQRLTYCGFSPDSQHLCWEEREPAVGAKAAPGVYEIYTCVDGVPLAATRLVDPDSVQGASPDLRKFMNSGRSQGAFWQMPARWDFNPAGHLVSIAPDDDGMKRFTVTPPPDTNLDSMTTEAKAGPARAAAKAAEEKKKATEAAAAKKAKVDADAAEAATKAKADADELAAKRKKDYDDAVAKRKADYDAAVAKRQADYTALLAKQKADREAALAKQAELLKQQQKK